MAIGDENVTIRINVRADTREIDRTREKLAALCAQAKACEDQFEGYSSSIKDTSDELDNLEKSTRKTTESTKNSTSANRQFNQSQRRLNRNLRDSRSLLDKVGGIFKTPYRLAVIGATLETAGLALALSSVNGLLITGRFLVKTYHMALSGLAKTAAAAGVALATVAAAQRQYIAAQATGRYGGNFAASSAGLRTLTGDARLASLGMKTLTGAFQAASKNAPVSGQTSSAIAGLIDFAYLTGDIEKGTAALANFVSLVQKGGPGGKGVADAARELGPEFEKAFKDITKGGKKTTAELMKAFASGGLAQKAGVSGTGAAVQGSLVGQLKGAFTQAQLMFGDLGSVIITRVQTAFEELNKIFKRTFYRLTPTLLDFAPGFIDKTVSITDKLADFLTTLMQEYVPRVEGFFEKMSRFWDKLTDGFERFSEYLNQFSAASKIINTFFGKIFKDAIGGSLRRGFENFGSLLIENQDEFDKFGDKLSRLITEIFNLFRAIREAFFTALPAINQVVSAITLLVEAMRSLLSTLTDIGPYAALGGLLGTGFVAGSGRRGRGRFLTGRGGGGFLSQNRAMIAGTLGIATLGGIAAQQAGGNDVVGGGATALGLGALGGYKLAGNAKLLEALTRPNAKGGAALLQKLMPVTSAARLVGAGAIAGGGAFATNLATDYVAKRAGTGATVATGAAGGAATGAAMGAFLAGPTAGLSIAAGAIIGGIAGGINGWLKSGKYKKQARQAAEKFVGEYSDTINNAFQANDYRAATLAISNFENAAQSMADSQVKSGTAMDRAQELWSTQGQLFEQQATRLTGRVEDLAKISGMSKDEIVALANAMDIDLSSSAISLQQILGETGIAVRRVGDDFKNYIADNFAQNLGIFAQTAEVLNAPQVMNELATGLITSVRSTGAAGTEESAKFLEDMFYNMSLRFGPEQATRQMINMLGGAGELEFGRGAAFQPGGVFAAAGISAEQLKAFEPLLTAFYGGEATSYATLAADNILSQLSAQGKTTTMSREALIKSLASQDLNKVMNLATASGAEDFLKQREGKVTPYGAMPGISLDQQLASALSAVGIDSAAIELRKTADQQLYDASMIFSGAVDKYATTVGAPTSPTFGAQGPTTPTVSTNPLNIGTGPMAPGQTNVSNKIEVVINGAAATDTKKIADEVAREVARMTRNAVERR